MKHAPWFEDFFVGQEFSDVPAITVTEGMAAIHQSLFGDRFSLPLDKVLCEKVTGSKTTLANSSLVCNIAIGQSTGASQRVMGNLFYRGLILQQPVFLGDTLTTRTKVIALRQNQPKPGRSASGMVALKIHTTNQRNETVLLFSRCPMIACKDPDVITGRQDDFALMREEPHHSSVKAAIPDWHYENVSSQPLTLTPGEWIQIEARDTVTLALELARLTQNLAMIHTDASRSVYGKRLVYGGHTISMAAAQLSRAIPQLLTILGWFHCDHTAPVFENDILQTEFSLASHETINGVQLLRLNVNVFATRGPQAPAEDDKVKVLDWSLAALAK